MCSKLLEGSSFYTRNYSTIVNYTRTCTYHGVCVCMFNCQQVFIIIYLREEEEEEVYVYCVCIEEEQEKKKGARRVILIVQQSIIIQ